MRRNIRNYVFVLSGFSDYFPNNIITLPISVLLQILLLIGIKSVPDKVLEGILTYI